MSGVRWEYTSGEVALSAATEEWPAAILAASNHRVLVDQIAVSFKGAVVTDTPVNVKIQHQSTATSSGGSAQNPVKTNTGDDETLQTTGRKGDAVTGTLTQTIREFQVHPQDRETLYFDPPLVVKGGQYLAVSATAPQANTILVNMRGEE